MGYVNVRGLLGNPDRSVIQEVEFLVDTGAVHTAINEETAQAPRLQAPLR